MKNFKVVAYISVVLLVVMPFLSIVVEAESSAIVSKFSEDMLYLYGKAKSYDVVVMLEGDVNNYIRSLEKVGVVERSFTLIPAVAMKVDNAGLVKLAKLSFVDKIWPNLRVRALLDTSVSDIGASAVWSDLGYDGSGVTIAVIDTGIDASHVALDDLDDDPNTFDPKVIAFKDFVNGRDDLDPSDGMNAYDDNGHGTHVAGIAAGTGAPDYKYIGVAPGANLVGIKVLDSSGSGTLADVVAGIEWAVLNKDVYNIRVINLSLGASVRQNDGTSPVAIAVDKAVLAGLVAVVAAGNDGPRKGSVDTPGDAHLAITVGAAFDSGEGPKGGVASFSSQGPTKDGRVKPDITAPGVYIMAPAANTGSGYVEYSGTSMATPHVAGAVALLLDAYPGLDPAQVKYILTRTTQVDYYSGNPDNIEGYGYIDVYGAVSLASSLSGGLSSLSVSLTYSLTTSTKGKGKRASYTINIELFVADSSGNGVSGVWVLVWIEDSSGGILYAVAGTTDSSGYFYTSYSVKGKGTFYLYGLGDDYYRGYHYGYDTATVRI